MVPCEDRTQSIVSEPRTYTKSLREKGLSEEVATRNIGNMPTKRCLTTLRYPSAFGLPLGPACKEVRDEGRCLLLDLELLLCLPQPEC